MKAINKKDQQRLLKAACKARLRAVAPYSGFRVGAALLTSRGNIYGGANIESASYGLTCCAERVALFKALSEGETNFEAMAVAADADGGPMPCGACRQIMAEHGADMAVLIADSRAPAVIRIFGMTDLLPDAFLDVPSRRKVG